MFLRIGVYIKNTIQKLSSRETTCLGGFWTKMPFYAVAKGKTPGIFMTWADCEAQVKGFSGARYKKFDTIDLAQKFVSSEGGITHVKAKPNVPKLNNSNPKTISNPTRSFSTSSSDNQKDKNVVETKKKTKRPIENIDNFDSDSSDDLNAILSKQMDDIEERLKCYTKDVDNIIKKAPKKTILLEVSEPKRRRSANTELEKDADGYVKVYTDGACSGNGRTGARAGFGVYWADGHTLNASEPVAGRATNNCGEIQAANHAIHQALQNGIKQLAVYTDSQFLINAVTKWMPGWKRKGWKLKTGEPVKNEIDFKELDRLQSKIALKWIYVEAHKGIHGNEMADQLAKAGAAQYKST